MNRRRCHNYRASHFYLLMGYSDFIVDIYFFKYYNNTMFNHDILQQLCVKTQIQHVTF